MAGKFIVETVLFDAIFNVTNRNLLPKIDLYGNRNEIGKRMIECGRIEK